jgi:YesN/AraC family two-component response regulator
MLETTASMLRELGYTVLTAATPDDALLLARAHGSPIHLLISDVVMPRMNGRVLAEEVRAVRPDLRCLFMSGYTADVIARHGVLEEGVHFLQKPFTSADLARKVRAAMGE